MDLNDIIFYVLSGVASLGGTSLGIGAICAWIKKLVTKAVEKLLGSKTNFDDEVVKLNEAAVQLEKASEMFLSVGNALTECGKEIRGMKIENTEFGRKLDGLIEVVSIIVKNNSFMVSNGEAQHCLDILYGKQDSVEIDGEIANE